jgi:hypothetical protein
MPPALGGVDGDESEQQAALVGPACLAFVYNEYQ